MGYRISASVKVGEGKSKNREPDAGVKWRQGVLGPVEQFSNKSLLYSGTLQEWQLSPRPGDAGVRQHFNHFKCRPKGGKRKQLFFFKFFFFFGPMQDLEAKEFVYLSIKNETKKSRVFR